MSTPTLVALVPRALLFDGDAYLEMKKRPRALEDGAAFLLALGAALGLALACGAIVTWVTSPGIADVQRVLAHTAAPWPLSRWLAAVRRWDWLLSALRWARPAPLMSLAYLVVTPLTLLGGWLAFGALAHGAAHLLGGQGSLRETLGCTALAGAPWAVLLLPLLPPLNPAGLAAGAWVLAAQAQAVRAAHALDGWRAFWATAAAALALALALALGALVAGVGR